MFIYIWRANMKLALRLLLVLCIALPGICNRLQAKYQNPKHLLTQLPDRLSCDLFEGSYDLFFTNKPVTNKCKSSRIKMSPMEIGEKDDFELVPLKGGSDNHSYFESILFSQALNYFFNSSKVTSSFAEQFFDTSYKRYLIIQVLKI